MDIKRASSKDFQFKEWINVRLDDSHKAELEHLSKDMNVGGLYDWVASMVYQGYSFSVYWDDWSDSQQVSLVCKAVGDPNYGCGLSARHPDLDMAILSLHYKHNEILRGNWGDAPPTPAGNSWG